MPAFPLLSRTLSAEMFNRLLTMLPPPADDSIEARIGRDTFAIAGIGSLGPIRSAEEASLAITVVAADCHAHDAFRLAAGNTNDMKAVSQCRSQAAMMLRTRAKAVERLERLQREYPVEVTRDDTAHPLAEAQSVPATAQAEPTPPPSPPPPVAPPTDPLPPAQSDDERARDLVAAKARYARMIGYPVQDVPNEMSKSVRAPAPILAPDPVAEPAIIAVRAEPVAWREAA